MTSAQASEFADLIRTVDVELCAPVESAGRDFRSGGRLTRRFHRAAQALLDRGVPALRQFVEVHNELCTAHLILHDTSEPRIALAEYEPAIRGCARRFDFHLRRVDDSEQWIEVKTIHPESSDRWEHYENAMGRGFFPRQAGLTLAKDWIGGDLYHNAFASRAAILNYAVETEEKVAACLPVGGRGAVILALFSNGFKWHVDELEDFVFFYRNRRHWPGDPFQAMEQFHMDERGIQLGRDIDHFMYVERAEMEVLPSRVVWSVRPAPSP